MSTQPRQSALFIGGPLDGQRKVTPNGIAFMDALESSPHGTVGTKFKLVRYRLVRWARNEGSVFVLDSIPTTEIMPLLFKHYRPK